MNLAPNGKPSNLTPEQYKLVRTPAFKKWFGDWELLYQYKDRYTYKGHDRLFNKPKIGNEYDLVDGTKAKVLSFDKEKGQYEVLIDGKKQFISFSRMLYLYSGTPDIFTAEWLSEVSKVVDENGEPLICYHGTTKYFNEFNYSENATNDLGIEGRGHYFSNEKGIAIQYAKRYIKELKDFDSTNGRVIEVFLKINNPASRKETSVLMSKYKDFETNARETQKELINKGFNGVIKKYPSGDNSYEFIVFESTQIKLADGTNTTFDANNPDIRYMSGGTINYEYTIGGL